jgi:hypothetical protein
LDPNKEVVRPIVVKNRIKMNNDTVISDFIQIDEEENQLYFMMAESRNDPNTDPLIIWL